MGGPGGRAGREASDVGDYRSTKLPGVPPKAADGWRRCFLLSPFPRISYLVQIGPEPSRARSGAAKRTLDDEDRSEIKRGEGKGILPHVPTRNPEYPTVLIVALQRIPHGGEVRILMSKLLSLTAEEAGCMHGLIAKMYAAEAQCHALIAILVEAAAEMPAAVETLPRHRLETRQMP